MERSETVHPQGSEYKVRQREDDEDLEMPTSVGAAKYQNGHVEQNKGNNKFAGDQAPSLDVERFAEALNELTADDADL